MEPMKLKTGLFGFRRKQVLQYLDAMSEDFQKQMLMQKADYAGQMDALREEWEEKLQTHQHALSVQVEENQRLEQELNLLAKSLEEKYVLLDEQQKVAAELSKTLEAEKEQNSQLTFQLSVAQQSTESAGEKLAICQQKLAEKDAFIAKQTVEVSRLQEHVAKLEEQFSSLQDDATQGAAMVNCLNLLHGRNRALSQKVATLEAKLSEANTATVVEEYTQKAAEKQQAVKSTENLFAIVRQEMQEALDSISRKIEAQSLEDDDMNSHFVDMSVL